MDGAAETIASGHTLTGAVLLQAFVAALHYLALGIGLGSVFVRGLRLRELRRAPDDARALASLFRADSLWGGAAALWVTTGLLRAFGGIERASAFYTRNGFFYVKMALFAAVFVLEIRPMITFIRWRKQRSRAGSTPFKVPPPTALIRLNDLEIAAVVLIPFVAALMARGAWLF